MTPINLTKMSVEVRVKFAAESAAVWDLLTNVERMAGLGPEHFGAKWLTPGPREGARFEGWNRIGEWEWNVICVVTECRPPDCITWHVGEGPLPSSIWSYELAPDGEGSTMVTQRFRHGPGGSGVRSAIEAHPERAALIVESRSETLRTNMVATLEAAARLAEGRERAADSG